MDGETSRQVLGYPFGPTTLTMQADCFLMTSPRNLVGKTDNGEENIWWIVEGRDYPRLWWERLEEEPGQ